MTDIQAAASDIEKLTTHNSSCEKDVGKATAVFGKMRNYVLGRTSVYSIKLKMRLYEAIILSTLLYSADVWPLTATLTKRLNVAHYQLISQMTKEHLGHFLKGQSNKRRSQSQNWTCNSDSMDDIYSVKEDFAGLDVIRDTNGSPAHTSTGVALEVRGLREVQVVRVQTGGARSTRTC